MNREKSYIGIKSNCGGLNGQLRDILIMKEN